MSSDSTDASSMDDSASSADVSTDPSTDPTARVPIVGLGASAGGVEALRSFFSTLPDDPGMGFIVVVHLATNAESNLTSILQSATGMTVETAQSGTTVAPNHVYVIPPAHRLTIEDGVLQLFATSEKHDATTIDGFFRSLAKDQEANAVGILLSGSGTDGTLGLRAINQKKGITLVQDPDEAEYDSMPSYARRFCQVDRVAPANELGPLLVRYRDAAGAIDLPRDSDALDDQRRNLLLRIFARVEAVTGHDFSGYKQSTVLRRLEHRMRIQCIATLDNYHRLLHDSEEEVRAFYRSLLIGVTHFFRDAEAFDALKTTVLPSLFREASAENTIRVWVPGCATGEEAYSLGMLLLEVSNAVDRPPDLQIFATDVDETALDYGREGTYPRAIEADVSPERLERFFSSSNDQYHVRRRLRDRVLFAKHDLLSDPPFSNLDLVSCRNLLIYLNEEAQAHVFRLLRYGLQENGVIMLGRSESVARVPDLFDPIDKTNRLFRASPRSDTRPSRLPLFGKRFKPASRLPDLLPSSSQDRSSEDAPLPLLDLHRDALTDVVPSMLVDDAFNIIHLTEPMRPYLTLPGGAPSLNLFSCAPPELRPQLRSILYRIFDKNESAARRGVAVTMDDTPVLFNLFGAPVEQPGTDTPYALVWLEEHPERDDSDAAATEDQSNESLQEELDRTHEQLRASAEEHQTAMEELEVANQELLSMNEELHSKNEELETTREKLESLNEELKTTNQEFKYKVEEVKYTNAMLKNLMSVTQIAILFLDTELKIRRFTPGTQNLFNIRTTDRGRPLSDLTHRFTYDGLLEDARTVLRTKETLECEIRRSDDQWFLVRVAPYAPGEGDSGVVIMFVDITGRRKLEQEIVHTSEEERHRIGRDLHDILSSDLAALTMKVENLKHKLEAKDLPEAAELEAIENMARTGATHARTLSHALVPVALQEEHLAAGLEQLCREQDELTDAACVFDGDREESLPTSKETAMHLYRIAHEAVRNAARHADATSIRVELRRTDDHLILRVQDNGVGIPTNDDQMTGLGLRTMQYRAHLVGASLSVESAPNTGGTVVHCRVPLADARAA